MNTGMNDVLKIDYDILEKYPKTVESKFNTKRSLCPTHYLKLPPAGHI